MNWMTVTWPMVASACLVLALINLRIAVGDCQRAPHLFFSAAALAVAAISGFELALMRVEDLAQYEKLLRWAAVPLGIMAASVAGFVWSFFGTGRIWLALTAVGLNVLGQIANLVTEVPSVRHAEAIRQVEAFGGDWFTFPVIVNGPWNVVDFVSVILLLAFILDASIELWKKGGRRRAVVVGGGTFLFLLAARGHAIFVENGMLRTPYLVSFSFVGVLFAMGYELGGDVLRSAQIARQLRESERRIDLAARAVALGFWTWDIARDEIWATDAARALFGFETEDRIDLSRFLSVLHPGDREEVKLALEAALSSGVEYEKDYRTQVPGLGIRWITARGRAESDANGEPRLMRGVVIDITAQRESEVELQQLRGQLAHAGRVSMMGQLASALAHELNQPLGAILRNAEAAEIHLQNTSPDLDELRAIVADIRMDDQRAGQVIERLHSMLKRRDLESFPLAIDNLLAESTKLARVDASVRRVFVDVIAVPDLPLINGDHVHLQQVLLNLLLNAMDSMSGNPDGLRRIVLSANFDGGDKVHVSVSDSGHGILPYRLQHIFEPFFTTKEHGMGMGLAISQTIIEAHGGKLWAENNADGCGAVFHFTLPIAKKESKS